jgi:hypothetical protein
MANEGLPLPLPEKDIRSAEESLKRFRTAVKHVGGYAEKVIKLERQYSTLVNKFAYGQLSPYNWDTKKGLFRKSPHSQAMQIFTESQKKWQEILTQIGLCQRRLDDLAEDIGISLAYLITPWTTDKRTIDEMTPEIQAMIGKWNNELHGVKVADEKAAKEKVVASLEEHRKKARQQTRQQAEQEKKAA